MSLQFRSALVIGAGRSGLAAARALRRRGVAVTVVDQKSAADLGDRAQQLESVGARLVGESELDAAIRGADVAIVSPGVPPSSAPYQAVGAAGLPLIGEIELAYRIARGPIAAITGTKGKSTTTALVGHILDEAHVAAVVAGNIGRPLVEAADAAADGAWLIGEVSSFQLETIVGFRPRIAALLNLAEDHLDRYPDMAAYVSAKKRILERQHPDDVVVANADDELVKALASGARARRRWFGSSASCDVAIRGGSLFAGERSLGAPKLFGAHNLANAAAAALIGLEAGAPPDAIARALRTFTPLQHRLEPVGEADGVVWIDDSKASTPVAAIAALNAFAQPLIVIAGGRSKRTDFAAFAAALGRRAKHVVLIGESAAELDALLAGTAVARTHAASLGDAVEAARAAARPGDVVLLAPACASFDMFESAEQRGERFAELARRGLTATSPSRPHD